jgi:hypothetical protein
MMRARLSARNEGTQKYFSEKTAFYRMTKDKYVADQTSSTKPVETAFCRDKQRRRNFS